MSVRKNTQVDPSEETIMDKIFRPIEMQPSPYGPTAKVALVGWAESDESRLRVVLPDAPKDKKDYLYWDKPRSQQKWKRPEVPEFWTQRSVEEIGNERFGGDKNWLWRRDKDGKPLMLPKMERYMAREWKRRKEGVWAVIDGKATYITGEHYFYMGYYFLDGSYPSYRDRDRRWYYAWLAVEQDRFCYGLQYIKHRRDGATFRGFSLAYNKATMYKHSHAALQSISEDHILLNFKEKLSPAVEKMPLFFRPVIKGSNSASSGQYEFDNPARTGKNMWDIPLREGLKSSIKITATKHKGKGVKIDGSKKRFYMRDESGKPAVDSIIDTWQIVKPTLEDDGIIRKGYFPTTVEEPENKDDLYDNLDECRKMWDMSDPADRYKGKGLRQTASGLVRYFTPAWDGLNEAFIGEFGESLVGNLTDSQIAYLKKKLDKDGEPIWDTYGWLFEKGEGSYAFIQDMMETARGGGETYYYNQRKKFPLTPEDAFRTSSGNSAFNLAVIEITESALNEPTKPGETLADTLVVKGDLHWVDGPIDGFKGDVVFIPNKNNGKFLVARKHILSAVPNKYGMMANDVVRRRPRPMMDETYGLIAPSRGWKGVIGFDPFKMPTDEASSKYGLSKCGMHGFLKYDPNIDPVWDTTKRDVCRGMHTHAFVFEYLKRTATPKETWEDALKAAIYFGYKVHPETNVPGLVGWFKEVGAAEFLLSRPAINVSETGKKSRTEHVGTHSSDMSHQSGLSRIADYIEFFVFPERHPFLETLKQWRECKPHNLGPYDLVVSSEFALTGAVPNFAPEQKTKKFSDIGDDILEMIGLHKQRAGRF